MLKSYSEMTPLRPARFSCTTQLSCTMLLKGPNSRTRTYALNLRALPVVAAMELVDAFPSMQMVLRRLSTSGAKNSMRRKRKCESQLVTLPLLAL